MLGLSVESLALFNVETAYTQPGFGGPQGACRAADVFVLGTPDYHGSISSAEKFA